MSQRFSDAELAAEWWRTQLDAFVIGEYNKTFEPSWSEIDMADYERHGEIARTIRRFATLTHAHDPEPKMVYVYDASGRCIGNFPKPDMWTE